ncbi:5-(carboxyamino)imidazole ribonucleotide synthase [Williamsia sp.]|uniref:5-(carboxyamino)imidazole ribonucleotide synthase n=1 Tax=Williamsia sp. TaxID=1872085 RepID=UPI0025EE6DE7|nr:5-(carboxyamino)imidazole ribonucleotide synthase [Williamsia sp.]
MSSETPETRRPSPSSGGMPVVAMVGGGQLARMTHQAAVALGQRLRVLAASHDEPAALVTPDVVLGTHTELADLRRLADGATVVTFDHEGVPTEHLHELVAQGVTVSPPPQALLYAQDKLAMRRRLSEMGLPIPDFADLAPAADAGVDARTLLDDFWTRHDGRIVLKAIRGGYDGRGVWMPDSLDEARQILLDAQSSDSALIAEQKVSMRRELSAMVARSEFGQGAVWPVVETVQRNGQCAVVIAPAPDLSDDLAEAAERIALRLAADLGVVGVMAVELFETTTPGPDGGRLLINELAMRPHNSGHWSMDGAVTGQFEQHLRAVLDYPLGDTRSRAPVTVMGNILGAAQAPTMSMDERLHHLMARMPDAKVHLYAKGERPDRKIGHVNVVGGPGSISDPDYVAAVRERAERAAHWMSTAVWTDGWDEHSDG